VSEVLAQAQAAHGDQGLPGEVLAWRDWALDHATRLNPLSKGVGGFFRDLEATRREAEVKDLEGLSGIKE